MYIIGGLKDVKKYRYLALYFMLFCLVFIRFNGQNYQKPTENEEIVIPPSGNIEEEGQI